MSIAFARIDPEGQDREALIAFMTRNVFPFHVGQRSSRKDVEEAIGAGRFRDDDNDSYWLEHSENGRIGFFRFEDLSDPTPLFDMRLDAVWRGHGIGAEALRAATERIFTTMPQVNRFEGQTREDNLAMRRTFDRCGWVQEAYYREGWPVTGSAPLASVAYSILRRDWGKGTTTPLFWGIPEAP